MALFYKSYVEGIAKQLARRDDGQWFERTLDFVGGICDPRAPWVETEDPVPYLGIVSLSTAPGDFVVPECGHFKLWPTIIPDLPKD